MSALEKSRELPVNPASAGPAASEVQQAAVNARANYQQHPPGTIPADADAQPDGATDHEREAPPEITAPPATE